MYQCTHRMDLETSSQIQNEIIVNEIEIDKTNKKAEMTGHKIILLGDLNAHDIDWGNMIAKNPLSNEMLNDFTDLDLTQINVLPSRESNSNILDVVLTNYPDTCSVPCYRESYMQSDHHMLHFNIKCNTQTEKNDS